MSYSDILELSRLNLLNDNNCPFWTEDLILNYIAHNAKLKEGVFCTKEQFKLMIDSFCKKKMNLNISNKTNLNY